MQIGAIYLLFDRQKITASKENGLLAWRTHIEGAIHIIRQRGKEMADSNYSPGLFDAIRHNIVRTASRNVLISRLGTAS